MLFIKIDKRKKRSYANQIYHEIRGKILNGELDGGFLLPSTRELSKELAISRNTVLTAYDMLSSEGFVQSVPGSGIYVKQGIKVSHQPQLFKDYQTSSLADEQMSQKIISFDSGIPALDLFPRNRWNSIASIAFREAPISAFGYDDPQGRPELRSVLADYLNKSRGIDCHPDQIIITSGAKQGLTLVAKCLLNDNQEVWLEDPTNQNVKKIFSYHTNRIIPIPVDIEGMMTNQFDHNIYGNQFDDNIYGNQFNHKIGGTKRPAFIFTTPSHQFPMGGILSIQKRLELINYAREIGCYLVEDDYDSEFRYNDAPVKSLYELAPERVIYIGTFSKTLFPSLRLGYMVLPLPLVKQFREWKRLSDHHTNSINQLALMRFIESGDLERHMKRMKKIYRNRRDTLLELLQLYFPNQYEIYGGTAGMHMILALKRVIFTPELVQRIKDAGVYIVPVEDHAIEKGHHQNQIILGYAHLSPHEMELGLQRIKEAIMQALTSSKK